VKTDPSEALSKVPEVTLGFWVIKIFATTLGETGGDAVSMSMDLGYLVGTVIFLAVFIIAVAAQIKAERFHPALYWATIIASTTVGTTLADYTTRSLGVGYPGGSLILLALLLGSLYIWYRGMGSVDMATVGTTRSEIYYWLTITFSQTLGTALGDWTADTAGLGYLGGVSIFAALLITVILFWTAFVLTRPLGAVVGDLLDKPLASGGLALSRYSATAVLVALIVACVIAFPQRAARRAH